MPGGGEVSRPEGPKIETRRAEGGVGFLGGGSQPPSHQLGVWKHLSSLAGSGAEPQPKSKLVHFSREIRHLLATILIIFVKINLPNFMHFAKQRQYRQYKATQEIRPVGGKVKRLYQKTNVYQLLSHDQRTKTVILVHLNNGSYTQDGVVVI